MSDTITLVHPATGRAFREIPRAGLAEVDAAIAGAVAAQRTWAALAPVARADALRSFARVVEAHVDELAALEVENSGHPIGSARWEASHVAQVLNYYAAAPERLAQRRRRVLWRWRRRLLFRRAVLVLWRVRRARHGRRLGWLALLGGFEVHVCAGAQSARCACRL